MSLLEFITSNDHKFKEMANKFSSLNLELKHRSMKYGEIQASSIIDVARVSLAELIPIISNNFIIEDAGLEVDALGSFPGPYSSYVYQRIGWQGILNLMRDKNLRSARFISVMGLYYNGETKLFKGVCNGKIAIEARGEGGFGYDPIFIPNNMDLTFAEMELATKNNVSHRAKSSDKLLKYLSDNE